MLPTRRGSKDRCALTAPAPRSRAETVLPVLRRMRASTYRAAATVGSCSMTRSAVVGTGAKGLIGTLTTAGVRDERVIEAFGVVPREEFVPPAQRHRAYEDVPLPI